MFLFFVATSNSKNVILTNSKLRRQEKKSLVCQEANTSTAMTDWCVVFITELQMGVVHECEIIQGLKDFTLIYQPCQKVFITQVPLKRMIKTIGESSHSVFSCLLVLIKD